MNSAAMEYNMSRHPELYYMDEDGLIQLNEEEYEEQVNNMQTDKATMIIRAKDDEFSSDTEKDKQSALSTLNAKYPNVRVLIESDWEIVTVKDMKAAENEHTQYVLTNI